MLTILMSAPPMPPLPPAAEALRFEMLRAANRYLAARDRAAANPAARQDFTHKYVRQDKHLIVVDDPHRVFDAFTPEAKADLVARLIQVRGLRVKLMSVNTTVVMMPSP